MEIFDSTNWIGAMELHEKLMEHMGIDPDSRDPKPKEIERKWIVNADILNELHTIGKLRSGKVRHINSIWLSTEPEVRLRAFYTARHTFECCMLCFKDLPSDDGLVRTEIQTECTFEVYKRALALLRGVVTPYNGYIPIPIKMWIFSDDNYRYEIKSIDFGAEYQLEIESKSIEEANAIQLRPEIAKHVISEVTADNRFKMAQYWNRTRLC